MRKPPEPVAGIVLAAGASTRMGHPKQLLAAGEETLLQRIVRRALASRLDRVVLVLGYRADDMAAQLGGLLQDPKLAVIRNPDWERGMSTSIIAGLKAVERDYAHVMVILADMPHLEASHIDELIAGYRQAGRPLGALCLKGRRTHPVILARSLYPELHRLEGDRGARDLFRRFAEEVCLVEPTTPFDDRDIDTPADYRMFRGAPAGNRGTQA